MSYISAQSWIQSRQRVTVMYAGFEILGFDQGGRVVYIRQRLQKMGLG